VYNSLNNHEFTTRAFRNGLCPLRPKTDPSQPMAESEVQKNHRAQRAKECLQALADKGVAIGGKSETKVKRCCTICEQPWSSTHKNLGHCFIGRGVVFCPFSDEPSILVAYEAEKQARLKQHWKKQNDKRRRK
ncbi:hypothetical protein FOL47_004723, partial [Perkinsus chesapeaki]